MHRGSPDTFLDRDSVKAIRIATILCFTAVATATAQDKSTLSFTIENDSFFGTDRYYTHGFRLQYMHQPNELPEWTSTFLNNFLPLGMDVNRRRIGFALGQELYTPARI